MLARVLMSSRALRITAWGAVAAGIAAPLVRHRLRLRLPVVSLLGWQAPFALTVAMPRTRLRDAGVYALQMWTYFAHYDMPDDDPEALRARLRVRYPIEVDRALGLGETPTVRLQRVLGRPGRLRPHDYALSMVHWSWFLVPHGTCAYILLRHPERFERAAGLIAGTFDVGLIGYWLVPTAPPWWAGEQGEMPPVRRIMAEAGERFWGRVWGTLYSSVQGNPFAAMPSLHFGTSVTAARILSEVGRGPGRLGWTYALTLGFGLVYLGEHYVIDLIAGFAVSELVRRGAPVAEPVLRAVTARVARLAPR
jgi:hypothetical protein